MLHVGIVGAGFMGATHAAAWAETPARLAAICSPIGADRLQDRFGAAACADLNALFDRVDVVDICTPTDLHYEMVLAAAAAGKHVVCEKPLARTTQQAREMVDVCRRAGVKLLVAHVVRFFPEYAAAKATVARGEIGRVAVVRLTRAGFKPGDAQSWFRDEARSGGVMLDLMIHDFDYARWVAGEVESVFAKNVASRWPDAPGDYALAVLRHRNGALSHIEGAWAYPKPLFRTSLEIAGDAGLIEHPAGSSDPLAVYLDLDGPGDRPDIVAPRSPLLEDPYTTEMRHFYDVITGVAVSQRVTADDGLAAVSIAEAAIASARSGRCVRIDEVS